MSCCGDNGKKKISTKPRPALAGKSLKYDGTLIMSEGHSDEFTVLIWNDMISGCRNDSQKPIDQSRGHHLLENHWSMILYPRA